MPAGAVVNPVNPRIPKPRPCESREPGDPEGQEGVPRQRGRHQYQFEVGYAGSRRWLTISLGTAILNFGTGIEVTDAFTYESGVWTRDDDGVNDTDPTMRRR